MRLKTGYGLSRAVAYSSMLGFMLLVFTSAARASDCASVTGTGDIHVIGNSFPALQHIAKRLEACNRKGLKVAVKMSPNAKQEIEQAFDSKGKSSFDAAVVSMATYSALQSKGQLQSMTDLVEKYRTKFKIEDRMLIKVNGEVTAIAFMQNAQNLFYRKDLFDKHGIKIPTTYAEMLSAAAVLKTKEPSIEFPIAQTFSKGFDSATEFTNLYVAFGGKFFKPGTAQATFNNEAGVKAITLMKSLTPFMTPNYLASNSDDVMNQFQQGKAAMGVLWASRASRMDDAAASKVVGKMEFSAAPKVSNESKNATHLWWDGVVMPKNIAGNRETVFLLLMEALSEQTVASGNDLAIWIRSNYKPSRFATGVMASAKSGAPVWPNEPYFGLAHAEIGKLLPDALTGALAPKAALDAAAAAYTKVATEKGFIK